MSYNIDSSEPIWIYIYDVSALFIALDNQDGETDKYSYINPYLSGIYMSKKKKNKKATAKRIAKVQHRKRQKRKLKLIKTKSKPEYKSPVHPMMAEVDAPPGFSAISMTQAVMEYSKSIFDIKKSEDNEDMNQALQISSLVWNYAIDVESGDANEKMTKELINLIQSNRHVGKDEAKDILDKFVTQKNEMFPPEVQVKGSNHALLMY